MGMVVSRTAATAVTHFTDGQFFLEVVPDGAFLVLARTGERLQILEPEVVEVSEAVPLIEPVVVPLPPADDGRLAAIEKLSERERFLFSRLGEGVDMSEIAAEMGVSIKTAETYRHRVKQKLKIKNRTMLLALAIEWTLRGRPGESLHAEASRDGDGHADGRAD